MFKRLIFISFIIALIVIISNSCYWNNEEALYPDSLKNCDTTNVTYSKIISPIIKEHCVECHGASYLSTGDGIKLDSYDDLKKNLNFVISAISWSKGYAQMPKGDPKLTLCTINKFKAWKDLGAPNN